VDVAEAYFMQSNEDCICDSVYIKPVTNAVAETMKLLLAKHARLAVRFGRTPRLLVMPYSKDFDFTLFIVFC
jgi:hypothetical protein